MTRFSFSLRWRVWWWAGLISLSLSAAQAQEAPQQAAIDALVKDLDYLISYAEELQSRYREDPAPVQFNYRALLEQLRMTRQRTADYLNERHTVVHAAPPPPVQTSLTKRR
ncbi:MAG TPA: hypothetical protein P5102_12100 [Candidatus Competibacteraceae bacterium]|nr:hypothetical protein [Candidatus Competibacteraceae bacterium]